MGIVQDIMMNQLKIMEFNDILIHVMFLKQKDSFSVFTMAYEGVRPFVERE